MIIVRRAQPSLLEANLPKVTSREGLGDSPEFQAI